MEGLLGVDMGGVDGKMKSQISKELADRGYRTFQAKGIASAKAQVIRAWHVLWTERSPVWLKAQRTNEESSRRLQLHYNVDVLKNH